MDTNVGRTPAGMMHAVVGVGTSSAPAAALAAPAEPPISVAPATMPDAIWVADGSGAGVSGCGCGGGGIADVVSVKAVYGGGTCSGLCC